MVREFAVTRFADFGPRPFNPDAWKLGEGHTNRTLSTWKVYRSVLFAVMVILYRVEAAEVEVSFSVIDIK